MLPATDKPIPDILDQAAERVETNGLEPNDWWDNPLRQPWSPGMATCTAAAIGVAAGYRTYDQMCAAVVHEVETVDPDSGDVTDNVRVLHPAVQALIDFLPGITAPDELFRWSEEAARGDRAWIVVEALRRCAKELREDTEVPA